MESPQKEKAAPIDFNTKPQEEFLLSANTAFEFDDDDDVFLNDSQSADIEASETPTRIRRISDVIDCVGGTMASGTVKRHSCPSASSSEPVYSATSKATNIKEPSRLRHAELTTESLDLGYSSPGAQSSGRSYKGSWFRFSTSNDADSVDAQPHGNKIEQAPNSNK